MINYKYIYTRSAGNVAGPHGGIRMFIDGDNHHRHYQESTTLKTINNTKFSSFKGPCLNLGYTVRNHD